MKRDIGKEVKGRWRKINRGIKMETRKRGKEERRNRKRKIEERMDEMNKCKGDEGGKKKIRERKE